MVPATSPLFVGTGVACMRGSRPVFDSVEFALGPGDALLLTGSNGSGKSSLLRLMAGLSTPQAGRLSWNGADIHVDRQAHAARVHYIGHAIGVKATLTAQEDLAFWAALRDGTAMRRCAEALEILGLGDVGTLPVQFLSSGQKRRLALARLLATPASLWLLDEPTVGLDSQAIDTLESAMARHRQTGGVVVIASHLPVHLAGTSAVLDLNSLSRQASFSAAHPPVWRA